MLVDMSTGTLVSLEEYLNTSYDPDVEYVDGVLEERNVGDSLHSLIQRNLIVEPEISSSLCPARIALPYTEHPIPYP